MAKIALSPPQIAYGKKNPNWILPARYYNADVKSAKTSIRFHVAHTSCFVKKVRVRGGANRRGVCNLTQQPIVSTHSMDLRYFAMALENSGITHLRAPAYPTPPPAPLLCCSTARRRPPTTMMRSSAA